MSDIDPIRKRLIHLNLLLLAGLLVALTVLVWRSGLLVGAIHETLVTMSEDLKDVSTVAGSISRDVESLRGQVGEIREKVDAVMPEEELYRALEDAQRVREGLMRANSELSARDQEFIEALLSRLAESDLRYSHRGRILPIRLLMARIQPRYLSMRTTLTSPEDFIEVVASQSMLGGEYRIVYPDGEPGALSEWMRRELKILREESVQKDGEDQGM